MIKFLCTIFALNLLSGCAMALVDTSATTETQKLYTRLQNVSGHHAYYGYYPTSNLDSGDTWDEDDYLITGKRKAVLGLYAERLVSTTFNPEADPDYFNEKYIIPHLRMGGILVLYNIPVGNYPTWTVAEIMPGGARRTTYLSKLTVCANYIKALVDENGDEYPVIVRPFHENDRPFFFWGNDLITAAEYKALWIDFVTQMRDVQGVHNVLYAYCPEFPIPGSTNPLYNEDFEVRYPGDDYVDIIGIDHYSRTSPWDADSITMIENCANSAISHGKVSAYFEGNYEIGNYPMDDYWTTGYLDLIKANATIKKMSIFMTFTSPKYSPLLGRSDATSFNAMVSDGYFLMLPTKKIRNATLRHSTI